MRPVLYGAIAFACLLSVVSAFAQDNASDDALLPEGVIVYVEQKPKTTRDGLASYLGVRRERYQPSQAIYDRFTFDLFTIDPDGSNRRQLTTDGMNERPRWSWDGEWIAYVNGPEPIQNLEVIRADGSSRKRLLENEQLIERFWWSHDSKKLLVAIGTRRSASRRESGTLLEGRVIDIESGKVDRLTNSDWMRGWNHWEPGQAEVVNPRRRLTETLEGVDWPHWSPDAQWVAFIKDGFLALAHVQGVSDSGRWFLYNNEPPADDIYDWSWDGRAILFNLNGHLVATTLDKDKWGEMWVVSTRSGRDGSFNTDGSRVVYTANPPGKRNRALFIVNIFGENEVQITDAPYDFVSPHWQPRPPK